MDNNFNNSNEQQMGQFNNSYSNPSQMQQMTGMPTYVNQSYVQKKPKKSGKFLKTMAVACCFGFVAGGMMFGVNEVGSRLVNNGSSKVTTVNKTTTVPVTTTSSNVTGTVVTDVSKVVENSMPSIVAITSKQIVDTGYSFWFGEDSSYTQEGAGSGIIVGKSDTELLIVTNNHVVADSDELSVQFIDGKSVTAYIKGTDPSHDLAVISIPLDKIEADTLGKIKVATLGDSDSITLGEPTIAIGNALGNGQSVTTGVVSAINRDVEVDNKTTLTLLQTDAAINPGNSGGALLNINGEVIGINAAKYSSSSVEGMGFAIPISSAKEIINTLMNKETRMKVDEDERGYIGINGQDVDSTASQVYGIPEGVYVFSTTEGGAADKAGFKKGYVITAIDGENVSKIDELKEKLEYYKTGEEVELTVQVPTSGTEYKEEKIKVKLQKKPETQEESKNTNRFNINR